MGYSVVSIARSAGAGGEEIGRLVATALGFRYLDNEIIVRAAEKADVSPRMVADAESTKPLLARILASLGRSNVTAVDASYFMQPIISEPRPPQQESYVQLIEDVIREAASEGATVIVGHGGGIALEDSTDTLRAFVTASPDVRANRHAQATTSGLAAARKAIAKSDQQRREFLKRFYGIDEEQPMHYDLILNTDRLSIEQAAALILGAARS